MRLVRELSARPYTPADAAELAALLNSLEEHVGAPPSSTPAQLARYLDQALVDAEQDTALWIGPDRRIVAAGIVTAPPAGGTRVGLLGGVHPDWRGRGVGREVMRGQLSRATRVHAETAPAGTSWIGHSTAPVRDESAIRLYRRFGMAARRYWIDMRAPTVGTPVVPMPVGLCAQRYRPDLAPALYAADTEAFAGHYGTQVYRYERWLARTVAPETFLPELCVLVFDGDELAGYVVPHRCAEAGAVSFRRVGVRRAWRGRGLASAMLTAALATAAASGRHSALLQVDADNPSGATGVYERVGFRATNRTVTYELTVPDQSRPPTVKEKS